MIQEAVFVVQGLQRARAVGQLLAACVRRGNVPLHLGVVPGGSGGAELGPREGFGQDLLVQEIS